jgi:hypothetical protein
MLPLRRKAFPIVRFLALLARDAVAAQMTPAPSVETLARGLETSWAIDFASGITIDVQINALANAAGQATPTAPLAAENHRSRGTARE